MIRVINISSLLTVICLITTNETKASNILVYLPLLGRSHFKPFEPLFIELSRRGHNVTVVSIIPPDGRTGTYSYKHLQIDNVISTAKDEYTLQSQQSRLENYLYIHNILQNNTKKYFQDATTRFLLQSESHFDLIMTELYHLDTFFVLGGHFKAPIIGLSFQPHVPVYDWILKNPMGLSYNPHLYLPFTDEMGFWQRLLNVIFANFSILLYHMFSLSTYQKQMEMFVESVGGAEKPVPKIEEVTKNLSLILVESHFSVAYVRPQLPNVVEVAGLHIPSPKALPKDVEDFINGAENGVIYVSMGTLINPNSLNDFNLKLQLVLQRLAGYRTLWKCDPQLLPNNTNISARKWLPQADILRHPKTKLFISHGGYHSIVESVNGGVPVLCLPFFTDQFHTAAMIEKYEFGLQSTLEINEDDLSKKIHELLNDEKYSKNAKKQSEIFNDRPMHPLDQAVYWTEYVIRHKGASHLKSEAVNLRWYEYLLLDVYAFIILIVILIFYVIKRCINTTCKIIFEKFFSKEKTD